MKAHKMTNRKTLSDVVKNQESIINAIKSLEKYVKDIQIRQIKLEMDMSAKCDGIDSLIKSKGEIAGKIEAIDRNIGLLNKVIEKSTGKQNEIPVKMSVKRYKAGANCPFCNTEFSRYCDLESHIETTHMNEKRFECSQCKKSFVTNWRLKKHTSMHKLKSVTPCKYYVAGVPCPFEKYGCKFLHEQNNSHNEDCNNSNESSMNISCDANNFITSTPSKKRKILKCLGNCSDCDKCANCIVKEMLQNGVISLECSVAY